MAYRESTDLRRRQIADAALTVIAEEGLARFTSIAIAQRVGLTDGALFRHFASKDEIVLAAIERVEELMFGEPLPDHADAFERLGAFFERRLKLIRENPGIVRLVNSGELAHAAPPEGVARVAALKRRSVGFVRSCLEEAAAAGALGGAEPDEATIMVVGSLFALANAGVDVGSASVALTNSVAIGVVIGLVLGKPIGITLASWLAVRAGAALLPSGTTWRMLAGAAVLGGVGFTMSLFIAGLAFGDSPDRLTSAKMGTLVASIIAGFVGWATLRFIPRRRTSAAPSPSP